MIQFVLEKLIEICEKKQSQSFFDSIAKNLPALIIKCDLHQMLSFLPILLKYLIERDEVILQVMMLETIRRIIQLPVQWLQNIQNEGHVSEKNLNYEYKIPPVSEGESYLLKGELEKKLSYCVQTLLSLLKRKVI